MLGNQFLVELFDNGLFVVTVAVPMYLLLVWFILGSGEF